MPYLPESGQIVSTPLAFDEDDDEDDDEECGSSDDSIASFEDWKALVVREHNQYRARYGAGPVTWSDALYSGTNQWAQQCQFEHR